MSFFAQAHPLCGNRVVTMTSNPTPTMIQDNILSSISRGLALPVGLSVGVYNTFAFFFPPTVPLILGTLSDNQNGIQMSVHKSSILLQTTSGCNDGRSLTTSFSHHLVIAIEVEQELCSSLCFLLTNLLF